MKTFPVQTIALVASAISYVSISYAQTTSPETEDTPTRPEQVTEGKSSRSATTQMNIKIGTHTFSATLDDNPTAKAFQKLLPLTLKMSELNGNEKFFRLPDELPALASNPGTIRSGDLLLYGSDTVVLFYKSFRTSYSYTRLGRINDPVGLAAAVGSGSVSVTYELK